MKNIWSIVLISIVLGSFSCSSKDDPEDETVYTVAFDTNGGSPTPSEQQVKAGDMAAAPALNPAKAGYVFLFWYLDGVKTAYNFQAPVTGNITLYARWEEESAAEYWQVSWELNGGKWPSGNNHVSRVVKGGTLTEPAAPVKSDDTFEGWYKEPALTNKISFPYDVGAVTGDFTLYAKWAAGGVETTTFTIHNTSEWNSAVKAIGSGGSKSYILEIEGTVSVPPTTGVKEGDLSTYTFGGNENLSIALIGNGTLALSGKGFLICLAGKTEAKPEFIIDGPTLQGRSDNNVPLLRLDYADLELKDGKIIGNTNNGGGGSGFGGGVYMKRGAFTMSGGEISNNICGQSGYAASGGGVSLSYSSLRMSGGTISGNTGGNGGGIEVGSSSFIMTGGVIKGNTAGSSSPYGGGVYVNAYSSFSKTGGIIYGSDASDNNKNKVSYFDGNLYSNRGTAVFYPGPKNVIPDPGNRRRETTLNENDNVSTDDNTNWE